MKRNYIATLALVGGLLLSPQAYADPGKMGHGFDPKERMTKLFAEVNATPEQKQKIESIIDSHKAEFEKIREEHRALHKIIRNEIDGVLTPEQRKTLQAARKERMERMKDRIQSWEDSANNDAEQG